MKRQLVRALKLAPVLAALAAVAPSAQAQELSFHLGFGGGGASFHAQGSSELGGRASLAYQRGKKAHSSRSSRRSSRFAASHGRSGIRAGSIHRPTVSAGSYKGTYRSGYTRRVWIPGCFESVPYQVFVPERNERVWIEPVYGTRYDSCGRKIRVLLRAGYWDVVCKPAHYETRYRRVWKPGHWEVRRRG